MQKIFQGADLEVQRPILRQLLGFFSYLVHKKVWSSF